MNRYSPILLLIAIILLIVVIVSWFVFPEWKNEPGGIIVLFVLALSSTLAIIKVFSEVLKNWNELRKKEKAWEKSPLQKTTIEKIKAALGKGGFVSYINRDTTDDNLLFRHSKIIITGAMKAGKTREAAEIIERAIRDDLISGDQIYEPSQTLRALDSGGLQEALKWELDTGQRVLLFIDDLPKEVLDSELEKWNSLFEACDRCPEYYVVATARSDQLTNEQKKWLKQENFFEVGLKLLPEDDVDKLVLAASGVFGLQFSEEARKVFVKDSDGRPETTLIGMRRLAPESGNREVSYEIAKDISKDSLEAAWIKVTSYLEDNLPGAKYWLDALAIFHITNVRRSKVMVGAFAKYLWDKENRWKLFQRREYFLAETFEKLMDYGILEQDGLIRYPEVAVEGKIDQEIGELLLKEFLLAYPRKFRWLLKGFYRNEDALAWVSFDLAMKIQDRGDVAEAIKLYSTAINVLHHYGIYNNRGNSYGDLGQHERAIEDYDKAIEINPEYAAAYYNRGNSYGDLGQHERAIEDYDKAIEINPEYAAAYSNRGNSYGDLGQHERAIEDYDKAIEINPEYADAYSNRGNRYGDLGQHERAIEDYDKAIEINPEYAAAYSNRGNSYGDLGQHERAIEDYDKAIEINPEYAAAYSNRGNSYMATWGTSAPLKTMTKPSRSTSMRMLTPTGATAMAPWGNTSAPLKTMTKPSRSTPNMRMLTTINLVVILYKKMWMKLYPS